MKKEQIHNIPELEKNRKALRNNLTAAEALLWLALQKRKLEGRKFRRQHSVGPYILDFYCPSEKLAIELDGADHFTPEGAAYDEARTVFLSKYNIRVVRFENKEVMQDTERVLEEIRQNFQQ